MSSAPIATDAAAASALRGLALVERRHVDLMRVSGCQCCGHSRMR